MGDGDIEFKLGKAISISETVKMFETEIRKAESLKTKLGYH